MFHLNFFVSIEEQIQMLSDRGLQILDVEQTKRYLSYISYYRINEYSLSFQDEYYNFVDVNFDDIIKLINFDSELRSLLMYILGIVEIALRTNVSYFYSKNNADSFVIQNTNQEDVKEHISIAVEKLSFGELSRMFSNLEPKQKKEICNDRYSANNFRYVSNWLRGLVILRNVCAHHGRLYDNQLSYSIKLGEEDKNLFRESNISLNKSTKQLFSYLLIIKKIIPDNKIWAKSKDDLICLINKYPSIDLKKYGFVNKWKDIL